MIHKSHKMLKLLDADTPAPSLMREHPKVRLRYLKSESQNNRDI